LDKKIKKGGDEEPLYNGKLISSSRTNIMNERRSVYGCMTGSSATVFKIFKSLERRRRK
jgi:hypothetical protein